MLYFVRALALALFFCASASAQNVPAKITYLAPSTGSVTTTATIVAVPGGKVTKICNTTAPGGGNIWLNPSGGAAVAQSGDEAAAGGGCVIYGTPLANPITGVSDSGAATYTVTRGN